MKRQVKLISLSLVVLLIGVSILPTVSTVYANTVDVSKNTSQMISEDQKVVTEIIDESTSVVKETIIEDEVLNKITKITSDDQYVYVTTIENGISQTEQYAKKYILEPQIATRAAEMINGWYPRGPWEYTGVAIGRNFFASLTNFGISALASSIAAAFGISKAAASFLLTYMGAAYVSTGEALANLLDVNGNGWIGLYKRPASSSPNGPIEVYLHKTL